MLAIRIALSLFLKSREKDIEQQLTARANLKNTHCNAAALGVAKNVFVGVLENHFVSHILQSIASGTYTPGLSELCNVVYEEVRGENPLKLQLF